ncbi:Putative nucleoside permease NupX [Fundidesulfovibrio magnetotacticus]|uniref:Nucleoside permease NupX n=1 Tax=Fundidesulfovibrio magnetotacticus TaxID=2730080 RepID=A0A6V8LTW7_9BACT|nr:nucleoside transporter C-terminal domain-containing protein [Fundidesulfovibrio magnetotacticus]GFK93087.1 Putative nucleoside permease NupX [Fundidesulfovibrio magnetotacticus]
MLQSVFGLVVLVFIAWLLSRDRSRMPWRMLLGGVALQFAIAGLMLKVSAFKGLFMALNRVVLAMEDATREGTTFVFGYLGGGAVPFSELKPGGSFILAFQALPLVIVIAALAGLLYHWGILPRVVRGFSWVLGKTMGIGGALGVGAAGTIFLGMIEAPLLIRPYLTRLTESELFALMATGLSCIAGTMLMLYAGVLGSVIPDSLGHILTASVIHAPAALAVAAVMLPEREKPTLGREMPRSQAAGAMDAVAKGAWDGMQLYLNILAMLIAMIALVKLVNILMGFCPDVLGAPLTLERMLGWVMAPAAWLLGIPWAEAHTAGSLLGVKVVLNEFIAFFQMANLPREALSERTRLILAYAMCSFANLGSVGIIIGGMGSLMPERRAQVASLCMRALAAGVIASLMTGAVVGVLFS